MKPLTNNQRRVLDELYWLSQNHGACDHRGPARDTGWASTAVISDLAGFRTNRALTELCERGLANRYDHVSGKWNDFTVQERGVRFCYRITQGGYDWIVTKGYGSEK